MRRSGFRKQSLEEIQAKQAKKRERSLAKSKNTPQKPQNAPRTRQKRTDRKRIEIALWEECKRITRKRFQNEDGSWTCYTSGARLTNPRDVQTGHGKAKGALPLRFKYDIRNLRPQSYHANINLGGMSDIFIAKLEQEPEGLMFLQEACYFDEDDYCWKIRQDIPSMGGKDATIFLENLLKQYKTMYL